MIRINLAPASTKKARPSLSSASGVNLGLVFGVVFVALIALLGGYWWKVSSEIARLNSEIVLAEAEKIRLAAVIADGQRYKREKEGLESRVNAIEQIARNQARPAYLMDAMADVLPPISGSLGSRRRGSSFGSRARRTPRWPCRISCRISRPRGNSRTWTSSSRARTSPNRRGRSPSR